MHWQTVVSMPLYLPANCCQFILLNCGLISSSLPTICTIPHDLHYFQLFALHHFQLFATTLPNNSQLFALFTTIHKLFFPTGACCIACCPGSPQMVSVVNWTILLNDAMYAIIASSLPTISNYSNLLATNYLQPTIDCHWLADLGCHARAWLA